jgi:hypothetical protein
MIRHRITSLQPRSDAFEKHNEELQRGLAGTSMKSTACDNWWRVGGNGLLSVPNSVSGCKLLRFDMIRCFIDRVHVPVRLAELTKNIIWDDWSVTQLDTNTGKPVEVIVKENSSKRTTWAVGLITATMAAAAVSQLSGGDLVSRL